MRKSAGRVSMRSLGRSSTTPGQGLATRPAPAVSLLLWRQTEKERNHFEKQNGNTARNRFRDAHRRWHDLATASAIRRRHRIRFGGGSASGSGRPLERGPHRKVAVIASGEEVEGGVDVKTRRRLSEPGTRELDSSSRQQARESTGDGLLSVLLPQSTANR